MNLLKDLLWKNYATLSGGEKIYLNEGYRWGRGRSRCREVEKRQGHVVSSNEWRGRQLSIETVNLENNKSSLATGFGAKSEKSLAPKKCKKKADE